VELKVGSGAAGLAGGGWRFRGENPGSQDESSTAKHNAGQEATGKLKLMCEVNVS
jgi:hypothetical protein